MTDVRVLSDIINAHTPISLNELIDTGDAFLCNDTLTLARTGPISETHTALAESFGPSFDSGQRGTIGTVHGYHSLMDLVLRNTFSCQESHNTALFCFWSIHDDKCDVLPLYVVTLNYQCLFKRSTDIMTCMRITDVHFTPPGSNHLNMGVIGSLSSDLPLYIFQIL